MDSKTPLFSITIAAYNAESTIERALGSCLCQPFKDLEIIVVDDGSTDSTKAILERISLSVPRIRFFAQENFGSTYTYNKCLRLATGRYIINLDDDDCLSPNTLCDLATAVATDVPDIVQFSWKYVNEDGVLLHEHRYEAHLTFSGRRQICEAVENELFNTWTHSGKAIRRSLIDDEVFSGHPKGADTRFIRKLIAKAQTISIVPSAQLVATWSHDSQSNMGETADFCKEWLLELKNDMSFYRKIFGKKYCPEVAYALEFLCKYYLYSKRDGSFNRRDYMQLADFVWHDRDLIVPPGLPHRLRCFAWCKLPQLMSHAILRKKTV